jgi:lysophospholipase L1-like esterase
LALVLFMVPMPWRHTDAASSSTTGLATRGPGTTGLAGTGPRTSGPDVVGLGTVSTRHHAEGGRIIFISAHSAAFAACERRLDATSRTIPEAAILGASYTAGVGPDNSSLSWSVLLARKLGWRAVIYGDSGAGYVSTGAGDGGPVLHMLDTIGVRDLDPSLVVLQFGHDDIGVPAETERLAVERTIAAVRAEDPHARLALVTVFAEPGQQAAASQTDRVIVSAAKAADPDAIIIDPLARDWVYPRAHHGLHPTAAGDRWIAQRVYGILSADGVRSEHSGDGAMICDAPVGVPGHPAAGVPSRPAASVPVHPRSV